MAELRPRALQLFLALALLYLLDPTPHPGALAERARSARSALREGRGEEALAALDPALLMAPELPQLHLTAARAALLSAQPELALQLLGRARQLGAPSAETACLEAQAHLAAGRLQQALDLLDGACQPTPTLLHELAEGMLQQEAWEPAEQLLGRLVQIDPASAWAHARLGLIIALRDPAAALSNLRRAAELAPAQYPLAGQLILAIEAGQALGGPALSLAQVGQVLAAAGEWRLARRALEGALVLDPDSPGALALLGLALDQAGEDGSAQLQAAVELAPTSPQVQVLLARHWRSRGQLDPALTALEAAARLDPEDPVVASDLASLYLALGDPRSAEAAYRHAVAVAPEDPFFWMLLARFSLEQQVSVESLGLPAARTAVRLSPRDPKAIDLLAASHYLAGDTRLAERLLWQALRLDPGLASAHYHLGLVRLALGDLGAAVRSLERAQALDPNGPVGDLASRSLANLSR